MLIINSAAFKQQIMLSNMEVTDKKLPVISSWTLKTSGYSFLRVRTTSSGPTFEEEKTHHLYGICSPQKVAHLTQKS